MAESFERKLPTRVTVPLEIGDRVVVIHDDTPTKAHVAELVADVIIGVTFEQNGEIVHYKRPNVFPLYRITQTPLGKFIDALFYLG